MRVLLVEDDSMIGDSIRQGLQHDGYTVDWVHDGEAAELTARLRAVLRRQSGCADLVVTYGGLTLNPATYQVTWQGQPVELSGREFALLQALLERPGAVLSRLQLEERLYGWEDDVTSNAVEVHIHHLRRKLDPALIHTVRGVGYMLSPRV
jgi:two-component system, OmpR family, response regulator